MRSKTARVTGRRAAVSAGFGSGIEAWVMSTSGFAPVVVPKILPFLRPTIRTPSFDGAMPIVVIDCPEISTWLTGGMVTPESAER